MTDVLLLHGYLERMVKVTTRRRHLEDAVGKEFLQQLDFSEEGGLRENSIKEF